MANNTDLTTSIVINAEVKNINDLNGLIDNLEQTGKNVDFLRLRSDVLAQSWDELNPAEQSRRLRRLKEACVATAKGEETLAKATQKTGKSATVAGKNIDTLTQRTKKLDTVNERLSTRLKQVGTGLVAYFSIKKIAGFFTTATAGAANLEEQLDRVQAVSGATDAEMAKIAETAKDLGASTRYTATQAAEGFEILARAGLNANESIETLPSVLALAQASGIELAEASGFVTKAMAGFNLEASESARVADVLAKGAASANTDVTGLGAALSYAAPSAAALGLSLEDTVAIIGKFADAGIDASRAGTALNSILSQFSNPASKFRKELTDIGITTNDFNAALHQLSQSGAAGSKAILAVGQEAGPALKALLAQGMPSLDELSNKLKNADGSAQAMAATMDSNLYGAVRGLASVWDSVKTALGEPILQPITEQINRLTGIIREWVASGEIKKLGDYFAQVFGDMAKSVVDFVQNFSLKAVEDDISSFSDTATEKLNTLGNVLSGIYNTFATFGNALKTGTYAIGNAFSQLGASVTSVIPGLENASQSMQAFADETGAKTVAAAEDLIASSQRLHNNLFDVAESTTAAKDAAVTNTEAVNAEVLAFNEKSQKLAELKEIEEAYSLQVVKDANREAEIKANILKLENELGVAIEGKTLKGYESLEVIHQQAKATDASAKSTESSAKSEERKAQAVKTRTSATRQDTTATKESTEATKNSTEATEKDTSAAKANTQGVIAWTENAKNRIRTLEQLGLTADQTAQAVEAYQKRMDGGSVASFEQYLKKITGVADEITRQGEAFAETRNRAIEMTDVLQSNTVSTEDLAMAQDALFRATHASIDGIAQMDKATLDNLQNAIDETTQRLKDMSATARQEAEDIKAELEGIRGNDDYARKIKQKRKLAELEERLAEAKKRNNQEEIQAYQDALDYQKQLYAEKEKQIEQEKQQQADRERSRKERDTRRKEASNNRSGDGFNTEQFSEKFSTSLGSSLEKMGTDAIAESLANVAAKRFFEKMASDAGRIAK